MYLEVSVTYKIAPASEDVADGKASPHEEKRKRLPASVDKPLSNRGHENRAQRVHNGEDNHHDDAVGVEQSVSCGWRLDLSGAAVAIVIAQGRFRVAANEGVLVLGELRSRKVNLQLRPSGMVGDGGAVGGRAYSTRLEPSRDPIGSSREGVKFGAFSALCVGNHDVVNDTGPSKQCDVAALNNAGSGLSRGAPGTEGDIASVVGVHDEDVSIEHTATYAKANP